MSTQPVVSIAGGDCGGLMVLQSALGFDSVDRVLCGSVQHSDWSAMLLVITWQTTLVWLEQKRPKFETAPPAVMKSTFCDPSQLLSIH